MGFNAIQEEWMPGRRREAKPGGQGEAEVAFPTP
jgi:hypothetical protein